MQCNVQIFACTLFLLYLHVFHLLLLTFCLDLLIIQRKKNIHVFSGAHTCNCLNTTNLKHYFVNLYLVYLQSDCPMFHACKNNTIALCHVTTSLQISKNCIVVQEFLFLENLPFSAWLTFIFGICRLQSLICFILFLFPAELIYVT